MPRCPKCGVPDYADNRIVLHDNVIYECSYCNHTWQRFRARELDKDIPPMDEDVCIRFRTCHGRIRECYSGDEHPECFTNVDDLMLLEVR